MLKRFFAIFIAMALMLSAYSCSTDINENNLSTTIKPTKVGETTTAKSGKGSLSLYFCYSDSLNPYEAESSGNQNIASLLFDSLIKLDENFNPQYEIASNVSIQGKRVYITLNSRIFSDGTSVTAEDVEYSIQKLKKSKYGLFVNQLENVASYSVASSNQIELVLKHEDKNVINTLDFPILKSDSCNKTNSDGKAIPPIGSGRYVFQDNSGNFVLKGNQNYHGTVPKNKIKLKNTPDSDALEYLIRSGTINLYYTHTDSESSMQLNGKSKSVKLSNLVYLGINSTRSFLNDNNVRKAISYGVNRNDIAEKSYFSLANSSTSLFLKDNSIREKTSNKFNADSNSEKAISCLSDAGYSKLSKQGYYQNSSANHVIITLLYNSDNEIQTTAANSVLKSLRSSGMEVKLKGVKSSIYKSYIKSGNYDIYLAEIKLNKNFDYTSLFSGEKNKTQYNTKATTTKTTSTEETDEAYQEQITTKTTTAPSSKNVDVLSQYKKYMSGSISVDDFLNTFADQMPFVPLVFRLGTLSYSKKLSPAPKASVSDPYYNIEQISVK